MKSSAVTIICVVLCFGCRPTATDVAARSDAIAREYATALQEHDFVRFQMLFEESRRKGLSERTFRFVANTVTNVDALSTSEQYPSIQITLTQGHDGRTAVQTGSLYVTSLGKIKYDPVFIQHPAFGIGGVIEQLESDDIRVRGGELNILTKLHIPTFGFSPDDQKQKRDGRIAEMKKWWLENRRSYDVGEHRLPISTVDLQALENQQTQSVAQPTPAPPPPR